MQSQFILNKMTAEEKIRLMEDIWADLTTLVDDYPSPDWHKDVLEVREQRIQEGKVKYKDWDAAKRELRDKLQ